VWDEVEAAVVGDHGDAAARCGQSLCDRAVGCFDEVCDPGAGGGHRRVECLSRGVRRRQTDHVPFEYLGQVHPVSRGPGLADRDVRPDREHRQRSGVIVLTCGTDGNVLRFLPPLTISDNLLDDALDVLAGTFEATSTP
jgi:hypothetical protein